MKDYLPKSIVFWNSIKSPVDVMSRLISHAKVRNSKASTLFIWQRLIMISLVTAYRMYQVPSLSGRILGEADEKKIETYEQFINARKSISFKKFLVQVSGYLIDFEPPTPQLPLSSAPPSPTTHLNIKRNHRKICEQDELSRSTPIGLNKARLGCHKEPGWQMIRLSKKQKCILCCEKCGTQSGAQIHNRSGRKSIFKCSVCDPVLCNRNSKTTVRVPNSTERQKQ